MIDTIFMNFGNSKKSDAQQLLLNLSYKKKTQRERINVLFHQALVLPYIEKYEEVIQKQ